MRTYSAGNSWMVCNPGKRISFSSTLLEVFGQEFIRSETLDKKNIEVLKFVDFGSYDEAYFHSTTFIQHHV